MHFFFFLIISYVQCGKGDMDPSLFVWKHQESWGISYETNSFRGFVFLLGVKIRFGCLSDVLEEWLLYIGFINKKIWSKGEHHV